MASDLGISAGASLALNFMKYKEDEELRKLRKQELQMTIDKREKTDPLDIERTQAETDRQKVALESDRFKRRMQDLYGEDQIKSELAYKQATTDFANSRTSYYDTLTQGQIDEQTRVAMGLDSAKFSDVLEILSTPNLSNFELGTVATLVDSIDSPQLKALLQNLNAPYAASAQQLLPVLQNISQGGDIDELPPGFNEALTSIMRPQTDTAYLGAEFIDKIDEQTERKGVVEGIEYDGQLIAKGRGDKMILGAKVTVNFGDTTEVFSTFLPDRDTNNRFVFRSDLPEDDAKAVSVADAMDIISSNLPVIQQLYSNPAILQNMEKVNNVLLDTYYPASRVNEEQDQVTFRTIYNAEKDQFNLLLASIGLGDILSDPSFAEDNDSQKMQAAANLFYSAYGDRSGIKIGDDGKFISADQDKTLLQAIFSNAPNPTAIMTSFDGRSISQLNKDKQDDPDATAPVITSVYGVKLPFDASPQQSYEAMRENFKGNQAVLDELDNFHQNFIDALQEGSLSEEEYAFYLGKHLQKYFNSIVGD